jgi:hypothetical protein
MVEITALGIAFKNMMQDAERLQRMSDRNFLEWL